jgi:hypothetical protein
MIEVYFNGCSPAYDSTTLQSVPVWFNQNVLETIATPPIRFSSCSLRGSVTSLYKKIQSNFGEFIIGVDGSYYNIKGLGLSYDSNGVTIYSEQPTPSTGPDSIDCAYNLNCVQLLCWDINRCSFGHFDVVCKDAISGWSCDVITNNACYFGAGTGLILNSVGTDTMPLGIKYQGKPIVGNAGTVCVCSDGSQFFYGNDCGSGVLVSTPQGSRNQLYSKGYPLTRGGCVRKYQGIYSFPVYCDFCIACRGTYFNGFDSSVCSFDSDMAWYNGVTDAYYDTGNTRRFPTCGYYAAAETIYPYSVSILKTCCCCGWNDPVHCIMPAPGDVAGLRPDYNQHTCVGCTGCQVEIWKTQCCAGGTILYCSPSYNEYNMRKDDTRRTDPSVYNSLMGLPIPLTYLSFNINERISFDQFKSCIQNGMLPISASSGGLTAFSIRIPIVSKSRQRVRYTTEHNVWDGDSWNTEQAIAYNPETERQCLGMFDYCFCNAMCSLYQNCFVNERIPMSDIWGIVSQYMDQFDLYISEGYATDIEYTPNVMISSMSCAWTCVPTTACWHEPINSFNKAITSFNRGVGAYDCFYETMSEFKNYLDAGCWSCAVNTYYKSIPGSGVVFQTNPIHYNRDSSVSYPDYQNTKYVSARYTSARPLIAAAWMTYAGGEKYCLLDDTTLNCLNAQKGGGLNLYKVNRDTTYILGNCNSSAYGVYCGSSLTCAKCVGYDMLPYSDVDITCCTNLFYPSYGMRDNQTGWWCCPGFHIITYPRIRVKWTMPWYIGSYNVMNREWY